MNTLIIVSGHSGSGKSSIMKSIMDNELVSITTRKKRVGEVEGEDYYFITKEEFENLVKNNRLIEHVEYSGNNYGLTTKELSKKLRKDHAFVIVDYEGKKQLEEIYDNCVSIFLYTEKGQAIEQMLSRGDSEESVKQRISTYEEEMMNSRFYDYVIKNCWGKQDNTRKIIELIIQSEVDV